MPGACAERSRCNIVRTVAAPEMKKDSLERLSYVFQS
jgi:hypothetical protein